jgi:rhodanese-related sulfurtransferase
LNQSDVPVQMSVQDLAKWRADGTPHAILDVREPYELAICQIDGTLHVPMAHVPARLADIPADVPLVVMCHHGGRSQAVVTFLRRAGRANATNLEGGIDAWSREIDTAVPRY